MAPLQTIFGKEDCANILFMKLHPNSNYWHWKFQTLFKLLGQFGCGYFFYIKTRFNPFDFIHTASASVHYFAFTLLLVSLSSPGCEHVDINLRTVPLDNCESWDVSVTVSPASRSPIVWMLWKSGETCLTKIQLYNFTTSCYHGIVCLYFKISVTIELYFSTS